jgi:sodium-dependent dicarboxylate transporter 2/3/5
MLTTLFIAEQIFEQLKYKRGDEFPKMMTFGLLVSCQLASGVVPWTPWVAISINTLNSYTGYTPAVLNYAIFGLVNGMVIFILMLFVFWKAWKPDVTNLTSVDVESFRKIIQPMSRREKYAVVIFGIVLAMWVLPSICGIAFPAISSAFNTWGVVFPLLIGVTLMCAINIDGKPIINFSTAMEKHVSWSSIMLIATTMLLSTLLTQDNIGLGNFLSFHLASIMKGLSPAVFVFAISLLAILLTNVASNNIVVAVLSVIALPLAQELLPNLHLPGLAAVIGTGTSYAFATPAATALAAISFSGGWIDIKCMVKYGCIVGLICIIVTAILGYPLACLIL